MFDLRNSIQEHKKTEHSHLTHPRSAPIKPDPDASAGPMNYGGHIYSMFQGEEATKQKKLQQKAYFQELTRQVQEKKESKPTEPAAPNTQAEKILMYSGNFTNEISKLAFSSIEDDKKYPRYQKKYEIENHSGINVNTTQIFGGVLQRDEALLLKIKKEEQQKEMQNILNKQIQEKNRKKEEEKAWNRKMELQEFDRIKEIDDKPNPSPRKEMESISITIINNEESINSKTLPTFTKEEENTGELKQLEDVVKKLLEEKEELAFKLVQQEKKITEMQRKQTQDFESNELISKNDKNDLEKPEKIEKPKTRPPKARMQQSQDKLKAQHEHERAKLAVIEEKLENARKKRLEQVKTKGAVKPRRISESQVRSESRNYLNKNSRLKTAVSPVPKNPIQTESPKINTKVDLDRHNLDRHNLDTAGTSDFIYPDSEGNFRMEDEIDKFVNNYEKRESPLISFKSPYKPNYITESDARFTFTSMTASAKRDSKPLVANKLGFPSDIFRLP
jgi:hypothetical protein